MQERVASQIITQRLAFVVRHVPQTEEKKVNRASESGGEFVFLCSFMRGGEKSLGARASVRVSVSIIFLPMHCMHQQPHIKVN